MSKRSAPDEVLTPAKKLKSDDTSAGNSFGGSSTLSPAEQLAKVKAEVAAKIAKIKAMQSGGSASAPVTPSIPKPPASAALPPRPATPASSSSAINFADMARQVAEAKRRAAASQASKAVQENPYLSMPSSGKRKVAEAVPQGTGLKMAAHPLLLDSTPVAPQSNKDRYKPMQPKFASIRANARLTASPAPPPPPLPTRTSDSGPKINPYAAAASTTLEGGFEGAPKEKIGRAFRFNQKGKYIQLGNQMRQDAQLEALKQRIAERAGKAGLDSEFEVLEKNIRRDPPPEAEWWDASLLPNKTYDDLEAGFETLKIRTTDSPITEYVQHPIPIPAVGDKNAVALNPLKLTKKEMKKMRRQRRKAEQQDKQDRIRMGLIPPDPPKVRLSNLMKVLTSDAVQDPTKVEARVRREVAQRKLAHDRKNAEAKLTDEQRRQKLETKKHQEEKKGLFGAVYKIKTLSDPSHRFKVRKNAEQNGLTGITIFNPHFSLVVVEGSAKAIRIYNRLLTVRIDWTEAAQARRPTVAGEEDENEEGAEEVMPVDIPLEKEAEAVSLEQNSCEKIWEGPLRDRAFTAFKARNCPTDTIAKDALGPKWVGQWDLAKAYVPEAEL